MRRSSKFLWDKSVKKSISSIAWPKSASEAVHLFRRYMATVLEGEVTFKSGDDELLRIAKRVVLNEVADDERRAELSEFWGVIDSFGIRDLSDRSVLRARLGICLLYPTESNVSELGEQLSWFIEVLGFLGCSAERAVVIMNSHFSFEDASTGGSL